MKILDQHPPPHKKYIVKRGQYVFTATPCYGMHSPWWVVRTMSDTWPNEADPIGMEPDDEWWPVTLFNDWMDHNMPQLAEPPEDSAVSPAD